jgi:dihydropteroate synthase
MYRCRSTATKPPSPTARWTLGAAIVNDISALTYDPALAGVVSRRGAAIVLMHKPWPVT